MAKGKMDLETIGQWTFILGVILAILVGLLGVLGVISGVYRDWTYVLLVVLGIIVGFLNISDKEVYDFLIAAIALMLSGAAGLGALPMIGGFVAPVLQNISVFVAPAAVIVALKAVYELGKSA